MLVPISCVHNQSLLLSWVNHSIECRTLWYGIAVVKHDLTILKLKINLYNIIKIVMESSYVYMYFNMLIGQCMKHCRASYSTVYSRNFACAKFPGVSSQPFRRVFHGIKLHPSTLM